MISMSKYYSELIKYPTFQERYEYLMLNGIPAYETFGAKRYLNQVFYNSQEWKRLRRNIIIRDNGCDLGCEGFDIAGKIYIHHLNPITIDDIEKRSPILFDPENLICVSFDTHQGIHYATNNLLEKLPIDRSPNDTCPWKR